MLPSFLSVICRLNPPASSAAALLGFGGSAKADDGGSGAKVLKMELDLEAPSLEEDTARIKREFKKMKDQEVCSMPCLSLPPLHPPCSLAATPSSCSANASSPTKDRDGWGEREREAARGPPGLKCTRRSSVSNWVTMEVLCEQSKASSKPRWQQDLEKQKVRPHCPLLVMTRV
jgi:hypothetical protein